jgi:hypothetical protein
MSFAVCSDARRMTRAISHAESEVVKSETPEGLFDPGAPSSTDCGKS